MSGLDPDRLASRLAELCGTYGVVGASLAVGVGEGTWTAASGRLSVRTGEPVTADSVFQIGSVTKVWTAVLALQLVDDGLLDLDEPVQGYLPEFRVLDEQTTAAVTARHLLTHTSGIGGDFFPDTGRGDDCLQRYVEQMAGLRSDHPVGATTSYCNAGFVLLGRLVEVLRGATWDDVLRQRLLTPLRLEAAGTLPEEALLWPAAVGHIGGEVVPQWGLSRCAGPAGGMHARATDLVTFARLHLAGGAAPDGTVLLSPGAVAALRRPHAPVLDGWDATEQFGLAWMLSDWGMPVFGHDGAAMGQHADLRCAEGPEPVTVAVLSNGGDHEGLQRALSAELFTELAGAHLPPPLEPQDPRELPEAAAQLPPGCVGTYERQSMSFEVVQTDSGPALIARPSGVLAVALGTDRIDAPLVPAAAGRFLTRLPGASGWTPVAFSVGDDGHPYLHVAGQATPLQG